MPSRRSMPPRRPTLTNKGAPIRITRGDYVGRTGWLDSDLGETKKDGVRHFAGGEWRRFLHSPQ